MRKSISPSSRPTTKQNLTATPDSSVAIRCRRTRTYCTSSDGWGGSPAYPSIETMELWSIMYHGRGTQVLLVLFMLVVVLLMLLSEGLAACGLMSSVSRVRKGKGPLSSCRARAILEALQNQCKCSGDEAIQERSHFVRHMWNILS